MRTAGTSEARIPFKAYKIEEKGVEAMGWKVYFRACFEVGLVNS